MLVEREVGASEIEAVRVEEVPGDRCGGDGPVLAAGQRDVDAGRDLVGQAVPGQCGGQAQGGPRCPSRDLQQVQIGSGVDASP